MRIVLLVEVFSPQMGYLENILPRYLSRLGADVHLITTELQPYYYMRDVKKTYEDFNGDSPALKPGTIERLDGFTLHVLEHRKTLGYVRMLGLRNKLRDIRPDIVQTEAAIGWLPLDAAILKLQLGYKLFTGSHYHASVFPLANRQHHLWDPERLRVIMTRSLPGRAVSLVATRCFPTSDDCADVAVRFFGVQRGKIEVCPLGVDLDLFRPIQNEGDERERRELRAQLGFADQEIVCIYTGRFSQAKNPLLLAKAIDQLAASGEPYRGLFIGNGSQGDAIRQQRNCYVHPFVNFRELPRFFRAADIGVWPTQESMSMLDAAASGLQIIVNDTVNAKERIEGNGLSYRLNDCEDLVRILASLRTPERRHELGQCGAEKIQRQFGWDSIARLRLRGYEAAMNGKIQQ
jgi:glycosyltransferase involved in cell wall biosynthesis